MAEIASHCWTSTVGSGCFWLDVVVGCSRKHLPSFLLLLLPPLLLFFPSNLILPPIRTLRFAIAGNELSGERRVSSHAWSHLQASSSSSSSPWLYSEVLFAFFLSLCFFSEKKKLVSPLFGYCIVPEEIWITKRFIVFHSSLNNFLDLNKPGPLSWTVLVLWLIFFSATK